MAWAEGGKTGRKRASAHVIVSSVRLIVSPTFCIELWLKTKQRPGWKWPVPKPVFHLKAAHAVRSSLTRKSYLCFWLAPPTKAFRSAAAAPPLARHSSSSPAPQLPRSAAFAACPSSVPRTAKSGRVRDLDILCNQPACSPEARLKKSLYFLRIDRIYALSPARAALSATFNPPLALTKSLLSPACHFFCSSNFWPHPPPNQKRQPCCAACNVVVRIRKRTRVVHCVSATVACRVPATPPLRSGREVAVLRSWREQGRSSSISGAFAFPCFPVDRPSPVLHCGQMPMHHQSLLHGIGKIRPSVCVFTLLAAGGA